PNPARARGRAAWSRTLVDSLRQRLRRRVLVSQRLFPPEVVLHVGEVPVRPGRHDVGGRRHYSGEALFHRQARLAPRGHPALENRDILIAELAEGRGGERRAAAVRAGDRDRRALRRSDVADPELEPPARRPARTGHGTGGEVLARIDEDHGRRWRGLQVARRDRLRLRARLLIAGGGLLRQPSLERAAARRPGGRAAVDGEDLAKSHLPIPRGDQGGARLLVAREDDLTVLDDGHVVGALHRLAAGEPPEARDVTGRVFLGGPHVDQVDR